MTPQEAAEIKYPTNLPEGLPSEEGRANFTRNIMNKLKHDIFIAGWQAASQPSHISGQGEQTGRTYTEGEVAKLVAAKNAYEVMLEAMLHFEFENYEIKRLLDKHKDIKP